MTRQNILITVRLLLALSLVSAIPYAARALSSPPMYAMFELHFAHHSRAVAVMSVGDGSLGTCNFMLSAFGDAARSMGKMEVAKAVCVRALPAELNGLLEDKPIKDAYVVKAQSHELSDPLEYFAWYDTELLGSPKTACLVLLQLRSTKEVVAESRKQSHGVTLLCTPPEGVQAAAKVLDMPQGKALQAFNKLANESLQAAVQAKLDEFKEAIDGPTDIALLVLLQLIWPTLLLLVSLVWKRRVLERKGAFTLSSVAVGTLLMLSGEFTGLQLVKHFDYARYGMTPAIVIAGSLAVACLVLPIISTYWLYKKFSARQRSVAAWRAKRVQLGRSA